MKQHNELNKGVSVSNLKLKKGEIKIFKLISIKRDKDYPDRLKIPACHIIPSRDTILVKDTPVDIACIQQVTGEGRIIFHDLVFIKENQGTIVCRGGSIADQEKYEFLMLSNFRANNPNRDTSKRAIYELIDNVANAEVRRDARSTKLLAMSYASEMSDEEIITFAAASGWNNNLHVSILRDKVEVEAESNSGEFLKVAENRNNTIKADIKRALDAHVINWDKSKYQFSWTSNGEEITNVPRSSKGTHLDGFLHFIMNTDHGESVYSEIKLLLKAGESEKTPATTKTVVAKKDPAPIVKSGKD